MITFAEIWSKAKVGGSRGIIISKFLGVFFILFHSSCCVIWIPLIHTSSYIILCIYKGTLHSVAQLSNHVLGFIYFFIFVCVACWKTSFTLCCILTSAPPDSLQTLYQGTSWRMSGESLEVLTRTFAFTHTAPAGKVRKISRVLCMSERSYTVTLLSFTCLAT